MANSWQQLQKKLYLNKQDLDENTEWLAEQQTYNDKDIKVLYAIIWYTCTYM